MISTLNYIIDGLQDYSSHLHGQPSLSFLNSSVDQHPLLHRNACCSMLMVWGTKSNSSVVTYLFRASWFRNYETNFLWPGLAGFRLAKTYLGSLLCPLNSSFGYHTKGSPCSSVGRAFEVCKFVFECARSMSDVGQFPYQFCWKDGSITIF